MALPMTRPTKHPKTGVYQIRKRVPAELQAVIGRRERIISLGTKDPARAAAGTAAALQRIAEEFATAKAALGPERRLSHREVIALCGDHYREMVSHFEDDPGTATNWQLFADSLYDELERDKDGDPIGPSVADLENARRLARTRGIPADADSIRRIATALYGTNLKIAETLGRRAEGDYSPDRVIEMFPAIEAPAARAEPLTSEVLLAAFAAEKGSAEATLRSYRGKFRQLERVLGFDDLRRVTPDDVVKFKETRLREGKDRGTVADDVLNMGAVCNWAVANRKLPSNPFAGLAPKVNRRGPAPVAPYDDDEAKRILLAARKETGALRWLPWLLCFTGARISELADLRRRDVRTDCGVMIFDIVPTKARGGKNGNMQRKLPLHPALIEEGFLAYVASLPADPTGPLFPSINPDPSGARAGPATTQSGRWLRNVVGIKDKEKAPNHSWRHRMEDELRKVRALDEVRDAITGHHHPRNAGAGYGRGFRNMPDEVLRDLERIPSPVPLLTLATASMSVVEAPRELPAS